MLVFLLPAISLRPNQATDAQWPVLHRWAPAYSVPGAAQDFIAQHEPAHAGGLEPAPHSQPAPSAEGTR